MTRCAGEESLGRELRPLTMGHVCGTHRNSPCFPLWFIADGDGLVADFLDLVDRARRDECSAGCVVFNEYSGLRVVGVSTHGRLPARDSAAGGSPAPSPSPSVRWAAHPAVENWW